MVDRNHASPASQPIDESSEVPEFEIERDHRFVSISADSVYTLDRGGDVTLSLIEQGPRPTRVRPPSDTGDADPNGMLRGGLAWQGGYTEVARVRINPQTALVLAMQLLEQGFAADRINVEAFQDTIAEMVARFDQTEPVSPAETVESSGQ